MTSSQSKMIVWQSKHTTKFDNVVSINTVDGIVVVKTKEGITYLIGIRGGVEILENREEIKKQLTL